jgi:hypothetical protein
MPYRSWPPLPNGPRQGWPTCQVDPLRTNDVRVNKTVYGVTCRSQPVRDPPETAASSASTRTRRQPAAPAARQPSRDHPTARPRAQARYPPAPPRAKITTRQHLAAQTPGPAARPTAPRPFLRWTSPPSGHSATNLNTPPGGTTRQGPNGLWHPAPPHPPPRVQRKRVTFPLPAGRLHRGTQANASCIFQAINCFPRLGLKLAGYQLENLSNSSVQLIRMVESTVGFGSWWRR